MKAILMLGILGVVLLLVGILPSASGLKCVVCASFQMKARHGADDDKADCSTYKRNDSKAELECGENDRSCFIMKAEDDSAKLAVAGCSEADPDTKCGNGQIKDYTAPARRCYCRGDLCNDPRSSVVDSKYVPGSTRQKPEKEDKEFKSTASVGPSVGVLVIWLKEELEELMCNNSSGVGMRMYESKWLRNHKLGLSIGLKTHA